MLKVVYRFLIHKYLKITSLFLYGFVLLLSIIIFEDISIISNYEKLKMYYNNCFQYVLILNIVLGIFVWGHLNLKETDDYKKIVINTNKLTYGFCKTMILVAYETFNLLIEFIIVTLIGYLYTKMVAKEIFLIFISLLVGCLFYSLISGIFVLIFDVFNYIYLSIGLFIISFTNALKYVIVSYNSVNLECSVSYYMFLLLICYIVYIIIFMYKEIA